MVPYGAGDFISSQVIRSARAVYMHIGPGASPSCYRDALSSELQRHQLDVQRCFPVDVWQNRELAELYFLDLFIEWQTIVEIQSCDRPFNDGDRRLMREYLHSACAPMGVLIQFGRRGVTFERFFAND